MNGNHTERLSQEGECRNEAESGILERASTFAHRVLEEIETLAGTTSCKSVQLVRLKKWAQEQGCWYDDRSQFGDFFDRGSENEVYLSLDQKNIVECTKGAVPLCTRPVSQYVLLSIQVIYK